MDRSANEGKPSAQGDQRRVVRVRLAAIETLRREGWERFTKACAAMVHGTTHETGNTTLADVALIAYDIGLPLDFVRMLEQVHEAALDAEDDAGPDAAADGEDSDEGEGDDADEDSDGDAEEGVVEASADAAENATDANAAPDVERLRGELQQSEAARAAQEHQAALHAIRINAGVSIMEDLLASIDQKGDARTSAVREARKWIRDNH